MRDYRLITAVPVICIALVLLCVSASAQNTPSDDPGYFLSLRQKGQLIWRGRMQDSAGSWYDIWIVPGYVDPARQARINTIKSGKDFAEYGHKKKYSDLAEASGDAFEWAFEDCLVDFAIKDSGKAWKKNWSSAGSRTKQRVFGWWLAYPWALLQSSVETVVRVPVGAAGTVLGTVWGGGVVPVYYGVNSTVKGTLRFGVKAVVLPASACIWNTASSPIMAMVGQKPAPSRADGFWVKQLSEDELEAAPSVSGTRLREELEALARWGGILVTASEPFLEERKILSKGEAAERDRVRREFQEKRKELSAKEKTTLQALALEPAGSNDLTLLNESGYDSRRVNRVANDLRRHLESEGLTRAQVNRYIQLLRTYPPASATNAVLRPKTDPLDTTLNATDVLK